MADLKRWFKVWTTLLVDMDDVPDEIIGKWTRLGCRIGSVGRKGTVIFASKEHAARFFRVETDRLLNCLQAIPGCTFSISYERNDERGFIAPNSAPKEGDERSFMFSKGGGSNVYGEVTVTMRNWHKYQEDTTAKERMKTLRAKKRGDEKRDKALPSGLKSVTAHPAKGQHQTHKPTPPPPTPVTHLPAYPEPEPGAHKAAMQSLNEILDKAKPIPPPQPRKAYVPKGPPHYQPDKHPTDDPVDQPNDDPWA